MTWFKVDDSFSDHPKVRRIPRRVRPAAIGLWTMAGSWAARHLTDGRVPDYMVEEWGCTRKEADALAAVGLWDVTADGWEFHDWMEWQPSKEKVEAEREAAAERQRRARQRAKEERERRERQRDATSQESRHNDEVTQVSRRDSGVSDGPVTSPRPDPTRPDPTRVPTEHVGEGQKTSSSEKSAKPPTRGERNAEGLCAILADAIVSNGGKRPTITKAWLDSARLLVDADARDPREIARIIDWVRRSTFWRGNVLSMPKLREKYEQLRLKSDGGTNDPRATRGDDDPTTTRRAEQGRTLAERLRAEETGHAQLALGGAK